MRKHQGLLIPLLIVTLLITIVGCGTEEKVEMKSFTHKQGDYTLQVPVDWKKVKEDKNKAIFRAKEKAITFYVSEELGGISIYTVDEVAKLVFDQFKGVMKDAKIVRESFSYSMDKSYRIVFQGKIEGHDYMAKVFVREQDLGIRHYLVFLAPASEFYDVDFLFEDIARSFKLAKEDIDLYQKLSPHYLKEEKLKEMEKPKEKQNTNDPGSKK